jgi:hypothetical protein
MRKVFILWFIILFPESVFAETLKVPSQYPTIQAAIDAASALFFYKNETQT